MVESGDWLGGLSGKQVLLLLGAQGLLLGPLEEGCGHEGLLVGGGGRGSLTALQVVVTQDLGGLRGGLLAGGVVQVGV